MASYVRQRLAEIRANPALRWRPAKRLTLRKQAGVAARWVAVLAQDKRLLIVIHLVDQERTVTDLVSRVGGSQTTLSKHLSVLVEHGIVECRAEALGITIPASRKTPRLSSGCWMIWPEMTCFLGQPQIRWVDNFGWRKARCGLEG